MNPFSSRSAASVRQDDGDARELAAFMDGQDAGDVAAADWLVRHQDGLTPAEAAQFDEWLAADARHRAAFDRLQALWAGLETVRPAATRRRAQPARRFALAPWFGIAGGAATHAAAAAVAFVMIGAGWWGWDAWRAAPVFSLQVATARGQQKEVRLPDGSTLWLDTATRADATFFRDRREVRLPEGQAMFSVQADAQRPFDVLAGPLRITVVGTRFAVRNTRSGLHEGAVSVTVEEGRVRVAQLDGGPDGLAVQLAAGQGVVTDARGAIGPVHANASASVALWRESRVEFDGTTLAQALAEFGRYGAPDLVIRDPRVAALRVSGSFDLRRLDAFARALPRVLPVFVAPSGDVSEIRLADPR
jgi:transmembrane sensor